MLVSYILRLAPDALDEGRISGEVQFVVSGARHVVRTSEELIALLLSEAARLEAPEPPE